MKNSALTLRQVEPYIKEKTIPCPIHLSTRLHLWMGAKQDSCEALPFEALLFETLPFKTLLIEEV